VLHHLISIGEKVEVLGMPSESDCENEMLVLVKYKKKQLAIPLAQLECLSKNENTLEVVADWHYWVRRGYQF
jgi:hypothetical protein